MLEELRQKPKNTRERWAFWGAFLLTFVIASVWLLSLSVQFKTTEEMMAEVDDKDHNIDSNGAFSRSLGDIKANISSAWSTFSGADDDPDRSAEPSDREGSGLSEPTAATSTEASTTANSREIASSSPALRTVLIATTTSETVASSTP